jgi:hypothetical protein
MPKATAKTATAISQRRVIREERKEKGKEERC